METCQRFVLCVVGFCFVFFAASNEAKTEKRFFGTDWAEEEEEETPEDGERRGRAHDCENKSSGSRLCDCG